MAEARADVAVDVSNRPFLEDFLHAFAQNAGFDLHVELRYGMSPHHGVEGIFKGLA